MRNISDKNFRKNQTHILRSISFFQNRTVFGTMWKNILELDRTQTTRCLRIACWIPKTTNTYPDLLLFHCNKCCPKAPQYYLQCHSYFSSPINYAFLTVLLNGERIIKFVNCNSPYGAMPNILDTSFRNNV